MNDRDKHWAMLEKELTCLLNTFASSIEENTRNDVREFVENREYGVALEWLYIAAVLKLKIPLSSFQEQKISELANIMEINLHDVNE